MPGRLSGFGYKLSMGDNPDGAAPVDAGDADGGNDGGGGDDDDDDRPPEPRDTVLDNFRDKMCRDLVLLMAYQQHVAVLPVNVKKIVKQLWLFDWPKTLVWDGAIDDLKSSGVIYCAVDKDGRPYEVYF